MKPKILYYSSIPLFPLYGGGGEISTHELLQSLIQRGYQAEALCFNAVFSKKRGAKRKIEKVCQYFSRPEFADDGELSYPVWRGNILHGGFKGYLAAFLDEKRPGLIMGHYYSEAEDIRILEYMAKRRGCKALLFLRLSYLLKGPRVKLSRRIIPVAISPFMAELARGHFGRDDIPVMPPIVTKPVYHPMRGSEKRYITFVNPIKQKGAQLVLDLAKEMPEEKFCVVKGKWSFYDYGTENKFIQEFAKLPNVEIREFSPEKSFFNETFILLVPSVVPEAFSRIVLEAHLCGIPVIASDRGALKSTVGEAGMLVSSPQDVEAYKERITRLRNDPEEYKRMSALALENSRRSEFDLEEKIRILERLISL